MRRLLNEISMVITLVFNNKEYIIKDFTPNRRCWYNKLLILEYCSPLDMSDLSNMTVSATTLTTTNNFRMPGMCCSGRSSRMSRYLKTRTISITF
jgi:hypothetical protein